MFTSTRGIVSIIAMNATYFSLASGVFLSACGSAVCMNLETDLRIPVFWQFRHVFLVKGQGREDTGQ